MAERVLAHISAISRNMQGLEGSELARFEGDQLRALAAALRAIKRLSPEDKQSISAGIDGLRIPQASKTPLLAQVAGKSVGRSRQRPHQDYVAWPNFGTVRIWHDVHAEPALSNEIVCQHLHALGCISPSKTTQRSCVFYALLFSLLFQHVCQKRFFFISFCCCFFNIHVRNKNRNSSRQLI